MKKKSLILPVLIVCLIFLFALTAGAADKEITLTAGTEYENESVFTITVPEGAKITVTSAEKQTQGGITVFSEINADGALEISYQGTPDKVGSFLFEVDFTDGENSTDCTLNFTVEPGISYTPSDSAQTICQSDDPKAFKVNVVGVEVSSYEWFLDSDTLKNAGGTNPGYTLDPCELSVGYHEIYCKVTLSDGSVADTQTWGLDITKGTSPAITSEAGSYEIKGTGKAVFSVTATGKDNKYQWYMVTDSGDEKVVDGTYGIIKYSGANTDTLTISCEGAPQSVEKYFYCEVHRGMIADTSGEYTLHVEEDPELSKITGIKILSKPDKLEYVTGDKLDATGLVLEVTMKKGTEEVTSDFVCTPSNLDKEGIERITVSYGGKTAAFNVTVKKATHDHEWSQWIVGNDFVKRECDVKDCDAEESYSYKEFLDKYPTKAKELGIAAKIAEAEAALEKAENTERENKKQKETEESPESRKKGNFGALLWVVIIIAVIALAVVLFIYFKYYAKRKESEDDEIPEDAVQETPREEPVFHDRTELTEDTAPLPDCTQTPAEAPEADTEEPHKASVHLFSKHKPKH